MHHVLIRDEADETLYRRITLDDKPRMVVCFDGDLYRVVSDPEPNVCMLHNEERLCDFPQPHDHPPIPIYTGDDELRHMYDSRERLLR